MRPGYLYGSPFGTESIPTANNGDVYMALWLSTTWLGYDPCTRHSTRSGLLLVHDCGVSKRTCIDSPRNCDDNNKSASCLRQWHADWCHFLGRLLQ